MSPDQESVPFSTPACGGHHRNLRRPASRRGGAPAGGANPRRSQGELVAKCRRVLLPLSGTAFLVRTAFAEMPGPTPELHYGQWCHRRTRKHTAPSFRCAEGKGEWPTELH